MKSAALAILAVLLMVNVVAYPYWTATVEDEWNPGDGDGDDIVQIDAISVVVPPTRDGDIMLYDYEFVVENYYMNMSSGNYTKTTLEANGQLLEQLNGPISQKDGYMVPHQVWQLHTELSLTVKITMIQYRKGEDNEPLIINGRLNLNRDRYSTIHGDVPIMTYVGGLLAVNEIKGLDLPVSNFEFNLDNWGYPDPHIEPERQLEEKLYSNGNRLTEGDNGTYGETDPTWNYTQWYNWSIDRSERVRGYDCARLNISMDFFGFITLDKLIWLSSDVPRPVRVMYSSYTAYTDENITGHLLLYTAQTMVRDGYTKGGALIPVDPQGTETFVDRAPAGDYRTWEYGPQDGSISSSSFDFGLEEALDACFERSSGLREWLRTHPSPLVTDASYSANTTDARTSNYFWNITLADEAGDWSNYEDWMPTNAYRINITKRVTERIGRDDLVELIIDPREQPSWGYARIPETDMPDEMLTLASSEDIWASIQRVASEAYSGINQEVDFTEAWYAYSTGGLEVAGGFGMDLLDTLAGITIPNAEVSYVMQLGNVWEGAATTAVAVDAESGRMVYITKVDGPQSLSFIFGNL